MSESNVAKLPRALHIPEHVLQAIGRSVNPGIPWEDLGRLEQLKIGRAAAAGVAYYNKLRLPDGSPDIVQGAILLAEAGA